MRVCPFITTHRVIKEFPLTVENFENADENVIKMKDKYEMSAKKNKLKIINLIIKQIRKSAKNVS